MRNRSLWVIPLSALALLLGLVGAAVPASAAAPALLRTDMNVLVISGSQTTPYTDLMTRDGIKYTTQNASFVTTATNLATPATATAAPVAKFQGVIVPTTASLTTAQWTALNTYASTYGVRIFVALAQASGTDSRLGITIAGGLTMDTLSGAVTAAGLAATGPFNYLSGPVWFPDVDPAVSEVWATPATAATSLPTGTTVTPLVTYGSGMLVGLTASAGLETMFSTVAGNSTQVPFQMLAPGILNWLTQGTHFGLTRNYLSVHIDDVLNGDSRWDAANNCTYTEGTTTYVGKSTTALCPSTAGEILMSSADVTDLVNWQTASGIKLDMAYNAGPAVARGSGDALTAALLANKGALRWINHTYDHLYYGCTQTATETCVDQTQPVTDWVSYSTIYNDIKSNIDWATANKVAIDKTELVSGEHSGLADINAGRVQSDNPNFIKALNDLGIKVTGSDNSKSAASSLMSPAKAADPRTVGTATRTLPRYPNSIYYNVASKSDAADEYNWIYGPASDPQGNCAPTAVTTCMTKLLDTATGFDSYIAPFAARETLGRVLGNDPRPHYAHQGNIAQASTDGGLVYTWLNLVLNGGSGFVGYKQMYNTNTPIVNPTMTEASKVMTQQASWLAGKDKVTGQIYNGQAVVTNTGSSSVWVPLSAATGKVAGTATDFGDAYEGTRSAWTELAAGATLKVDIAANVAPVASFTASCSTGTCTFTSTSTDVDSEKGSFAYAWDFGDGSTSTTGPVIAHTYTTDGTYTVNLTVTDLRGGVGTATPQKVTITGTPNKERPVAVAETVTCTDLACEFSGAKSSDPDGIKGYAWNFGDGSVGTGASVKHTFPAAGDYTVTLVVTDNKGGVSDPASVKASVTAARVNQGPTAAFTATCLGLTCAADASASSDPDGKIVSYQWTFGDGTGASGIHPMGHVFPGAGAYNVTLTVYDNEGAAASVAKTVTVTAPAAGPVTAVKAKAVSKAGKIKVDVDPNLKKSGYWKVNVQKLNKDGSWTTLKKSYKTQGKKETRTINLKKGTYRVLTQPKYGYGSGTSSVVVLKK